jgi:hypothetical protein
VSILVDAAADVHPISPLIYGVAAFDNVSATLSGLNSPINRHGGNATSLYNWQINAGNRGMDWYFESIDEGAATPAKSLLDLVAANKQAQAASLITIGMTGWVAKRGPARAKTACFRSPSTRRKAATTRSGCPMPATASRPVATSPATIPTIARCRLTPISRRLVNC